MKKDGNKPAEHGLFFCVGTSDFAPYLAAWAHLRWAG